MRYIFLVSGKMRSGKDTVGGFIKDSLIALEREAVVGSFADDLKKMCVDVFADFANVLNFHVERVRDVAMSLISSHFADGLTKSGQLTNMLNTDLNGFRISKESWYDKKTDLTRCLLQTLGTNIIRDIIDPLYWAKILVNKSYKTDADFIVTDCRFENEIGAFYDKYANDPNVRIVTVRVERKQQYAMTAAHSSEHDLDGSLFEYVISNDGSLDDLRDAATNIVTDILTEL